MTDSTLAHEAPPGSGQQPLLEGPTGCAEGAPDWFCNAQAAAWERFDALPMPARTDETWRYSDLKRLDLAPYHAPAPVPAGEAETLLASSTALGGASPALTFANDTLLRQVELPGELKARGVVLLPLAEALREHGDLVRQYFFRHEAKLGGEKFAALHRSYVRAGTFLFVPEGVKIEKPIEVFHWLSGEGVSAFPHTLLVAGPGSKVTLIDHYRSARPGERGIACGMNDLHAATGATVVYGCIQDWNTATLSLQLNTTEVGEGASVTGLNLNLGARCARVESRSVLLGEGGRSDMLAISAGEAGQLFDLRTLQDHAERGCVSDLLFKNVLADNARAIFSGLIRVERGAHQTDAYQTNRSLLLGEDAESDSMPGLEIMADDVKCSHGSTTADIDDEEMFYLRARGIPPHEARRLLVLGFLNEVLTRLDSESLREYLQGFVEAKFAGMKS